jgi:putative N6-adenine-specific DNA methylase
MRKFFVGCNIHFESELESELREIWPLLIGLDGRAHSDPLEILDIVPGGVLLQAPLHLGLQINFFSKLANRVLLRLHESRVRDFPKLFQILKDLRKDPFLQGQELGVEVAASESRLNNEKRIEEIVHELYGVHEDSAQRLYIRMYQDLCSISLDTSGSHLHKRSQRLSQGEAPLRETLAAFVLRKMIGDRSAAELQNITLVDPMCGTGTLLREASTLFQASKRQDFAFLSWPQTPKLFKSSSLFGNYPPQPSLFSHLKAADKDAASTERAQNSLSQLGRSFEVETRDLFQSSVAIARTPDPGHQSSVWVISNPPYGERLKADFSAEELISQINRVYQPSRIGLLLGENQTRSLKQTALPSGLKIESQWPFQNGGLRVAFSIFSRE